MTVKLGIIGGSGLYNLDNIEKSSWHTISTPWGEPSDQILSCSISGKEVVFLPRHNRNHNLSPSKINYRANIDALKQMGVTDIISVSAAGSLKEELTPGLFVIVDQFIDRTYLREKTFFDAEIVAHVSMACPTSLNLMNLCKKSLISVGIDYKFNGTYLAIEGPQFSTLAESNLYRSWNADVIGMTNMPEAKLAREAEIRYASIAMVTDYDCWHPNYDNVNVSIVIETLNKNAKNAKAMIRALIKHYDDNVMINDSASSCLDTAIISDLSSVTKETESRIKNIASRIFKSNAS
jgi:5'-methylthioadenosine phosphorylase